MPVAIYSSKFLLLELFGYLPSSFCIVPVQNRKNFLPLKYLQTVTKLFSHVLFVKLNSKTALLSWWKGTALCPLITPVLVTELPIYQKTFWLAKNRIGHNLPESDRFLLKIPIYSFQMYLDLWINAALRSYVLVDHLPQILFSHYVITSWCISQFKSRVLFFGPGCMVFFPLVIWKCTPLVYVYSLLIR